MATLFFILIGAISLASAIGVVTSNQPIHSALFLLAHFGMLAILYVTLEAQFLAAIQVIIYAGGIIILMLFVIMLIGSEKLESSQSDQRMWTPYVGVALGIVLLGGLAYSLLPSFGGIAPQSAALQGGAPPAVGLELFSQYILPFELAAVLLLVALLGALLLARRTKLKTEK